MYCIYCGEPVVELVKFCAACGEKIQRPQDQEQRSERSVSVDLDVDSEANADLNTLVVEPSTDSPAFVGTPLTVNAPNSPETTPVAKTDKEQRSERSVLVPPISETSEASGDLIADAVPDPVDQADGSVDLPLEQTRSTLDIAGDDLVSPVPNLPTSRGRKPMGFFESVKHCWSHSFSFAGRASRSEFWFFTLFCVLVWIPFIGLSFIAAALEDVGAGSIGGFLGVATLVLFFILFLASSVSGLAVSVRRLHDIGASGWWLWVNLIPYIGSLVLFFVYMYESDEGDNRFGPSPVQSVLVNDSSVNDAENTETKLN